MGILATNIIVVITSTLMIGDGLVGLFIVFNATFNNISAISWRSVLLVDKNEVPEENHRLCVDIGGIVDNHCLSFHTQALHRQI